MNGIFEFKIDNQKDWVLASNLSDAKSFYERHIGDKVEGIGGRKIEGTELHTSFRLDLNEPEPEFWEDEYEEIPDWYNEEDYFDGYKIIETFSQYLIRNQDSKPEVFATTRF